MRARHLAGRDGRWGAYWERLRASYWFVPICMVVVALALAFGTLALDHGEGRSITLAVPWIFSGVGQDGAREVLSVVAGSVLTVTGVTLSITVLALQLASSQFGPRVLHNFLRDRGNQIALGTFVSTFAYTIVVLRAVRGEGEGGFTPHLSVNVTMLLALASILVLIYFVNHVAQAIRAESVVSSIGSELSGAIEELFPERIGEGETGDEREDPEAAALESRIREHGVPVRATHTGYVQSIDGTRLLQATTASDGVALLEVQPGDFVATGRLVARLWPPERPASSTETASAVERALVLGTHRTLVQDVGFGFYQATEVAIRSLSPSLNDPHTAMLCVDHLGASLDALLGRRIPSRFRYHEGRLRIILPTPGFEPLLRACMAPIRRYAKAAPDVLIRMVVTMEQLAGSVRRRADWVSLNEQLGEVAGALGRLPLEPSERRAAAEAVRRAREALLAHAGETAPTPIPH